MNKWFLVFLFLILCLLILFIAKRIKQKKKVPIVAYLGTGIVVILGLLHILSNKPEISKKDQLPFDSPKHFATPDSDMFAMTPSPNTQPSPSKLDRKLQMLGRTPPKYETLLRQMDAGFEFQVDQDAREMETFMVISKDKMESEFKKEQEKDKKFLQPRLQLITDEQASRLRAEIKKLLQQKYDTVVIEYELLPSIVRQWHSKVPMDVANIISKFYGAVKTKQHRISTFIALSENDAIEKVQKFRTYVADWLLYVEYMVFKHWNQMTSDAHLTKFIETFVKGEFEFAKQYFGHLIELDLCGSWLQILYDAYFAGTAVRPLTKGACVYPIVYLPCNNDMSEYSAEHLVQQLRIKAFWAALTILVSESCNPFELFKQETWANIETITNFQEVVSLDSGKKQLFPKMPILDVYNKILFSVKVNEHSIY